MKDGVSLARRPLASPLRRSFGRLQRSFWLAHGCAEIIEQGFTYPDRHRRLTEVCQTLLAGGVKSGDASTWKSDGKIDDSAGEPTRITGTVGPVSKRPRPPAARNEGFVSLCKATFCRQSIPRSDYESRELWDLGLRAEDSTSCD